MLISRDRCDARAPRVHCGIEIHLVMPLSAVYAGICERLFSWSCSVGVPRPPTKRGYSSARTPERSSPLSGARTALESFQRRSSPLSGDARTALESSQRRGDGARVLSAAWGQRSSHLSGGAGTLLDFSLLSDGADAAEMTGTGDTPTGRPGRYILVSKTTDD